MRDTSVTGVQTCALPIFNHRQLWLSGRDTCNTPWQALPEVQLLLRSACALIEGAVPSRKRTPTLSLCLCPAASGTDQGIAPAGCRTWRDLRSDLGRHTPVQ